MALTTQLRVIIEGNAEGLIGQLTKAGRESKNVFSEVSRSAKAEFAAATREADKAFKEVARLQASANRADKTSPQSGLGNALRSQAAAKAVEADKFAAVAVSAEKRIQAEAAKTAASHAAEAAGVSKLSGQYAQSGGIISRVFGSVRSDSGGAAKGITVLKDAVGGLGQGTGLLGGFANAASSGLKGLASSAGSAGGAATGLAAGVAAAGVGIGVLAKVTESGLKHFQEYAGEVRNVQRITGASAEGASLLAGQFRHFGIDVDAGSKALGIFAKNAETNGGKKLTDLGITIARTKTGNVDLVKSLENAGDAFKKYGTGAEGTNLALQAFGRGGATIIPLLKATHGELEAINRATSKQGLKFNEQDLKDAKELTLATRELHHSFEGLQVSAAKGLAPLFTRQAEGAATVLDQLNQITQKTGGLEKLVGAGLKGGLAAIGVPILPQVFDALNLFGDKSSKAAKDQSILQQAVADSGNETSSFAAKMLNAGDSLDEINVLIQQSGKSVEELGTSANISPEFDTLAASLTSMGNSATFAGQESDTLKAKLDLLGQGAISLAASQTNVEAAQASLSKALQDNGRDFDNHTEKGRANRQAMEQDASAILGNISALQQQGASVGEVSAAWDGQVGALTRTLQQAGLTDAQINALLRDYGLIPATKETIVNAQTAAAEANLQRLIAEFNNLPQETDISVNIRGGLGQGGVGRARGAHALGGPVSHGGDYTVGERGPELFVPLRKTPVLSSTAARLVHSADKESRQSLVQLGVPGGIERGPSHKGTPALLLGQHGEQAFSPPTDGVIVKASDTERLKHIQDAATISDILKRAGADKRTLDALAGAPARAIGGPAKKHQPYEVGEHGIELFVPSQRTPGASHAAAKLVTQPIEGANDGLVRFGIPAGVQSKATHKGAPALLLGVHGPQMFTPPTDGVVVRASDTQRLKGTHDAGLISDILKRAGIDRRTLDALTKAPERAGGGRVEQGKPYSVGETGAEAFVPNFNFTRGGTAAVVAPGIKRGADGSYNISIGDTNLTVEGVTMGSTKGVSEKDVAAIVRKHQAAMANDLARSLEQGKR